MLVWLARSPLGSVVKVFVAVVVGALVADWSKAGVIDFGNWQSWLIAGAVSALPLLVNWLNPADPRYGRGAGS